jgi:Fe-S-cluster containining protein
VREYNIHIACSCTIISYGGVVLDLEALFERTRHAERRVAGEVLRELAGKLPPLSCRAGEGPGVRALPPLPLGEGRDEGSSLDALLSLVDAAADRVAALAAIYPTPPGEEPACRAGCAWCCHVQVAVSAPEAIRVAEHIRRAFSPELAADLTRRVAELDAATRGLDPDARVATRLPCALLVDDRCAVYPVRPLLCRAWHSLDARACEANYREPDRVPAPFGELRRGLAAHVALGLDDAIWDVGLGEAGVDLDLTAALRIALEVPDSAARWLAGEPVFAPARAEG